MERIQALQKGDELGTQPVPAVKADFAPEENAPFLIASTTVESFIAPPELRTPRAPEAAERALDIVLASLLLLLVLPLMGVCALLVLFSGPGPLLYRQQRVGLGGQEFTCLKFRTMICDADGAIEQLLRNNLDARAQWIAVQKLKDDPRVTYFGRFLRRYFLDELPQILNVLAGDMSIVGPRPIVPSEIERYGSKFADYCSVKPGLTGLWQVSGRHALSYEERVQLDSDYARSKSVGTDLRILWRTVPVVMLGLSE